MRGNWKIDDKKVINKTRALAKAKVVKRFFFSITNVKRNKFSYQPLENFAKRELLSTLDV